MHQKALANISKVLKPGGTFWINTCTPHQTMAAYWWMQLIPQAATRVAERMTPLPVFQEQLQRAGLAFLKNDLPEEPLYPRNCLFDVNAPFSESFRKSDSTWTLASEDELKAGLDWWKRMIDEGKAEKILEEQEAIRKIIGQTSCITSQKQK